MSSGVFQPQTQHSNIHCNQLHLITSFRPTTLYITYCCKDVSEMEVGYLLLCSWSSLQELWSHCLASAFPTGTLPLLSFTHPLAPPITTPTWHYHHPPQKINMTNEVELQYIVPVRGSGCRGQWVWQPHLLTAARLPSTEHVQWTPMPAVAEHVAEANSQGCRQWWPWRYEH